jgi:hypothetical protein
MRLHIDPELRRGPKGTGEQPSRLGRHAALASDELIDPLNRYAEMLRKSDLTHAQGLQEVLQQDLAGMGGNPVLGSISTPGDSHQSQPHTHRHYHARAPAIHAQLGIGNLGATPMNFLSSQRLRDNHRPQDDEGVCLYASRPE